MNVLENRISHVARLLTLPILTFNHTVRLFYPSSRCQDGETQDASSAPIITRKKFSDLPKQRLLSDGTPAVPMADWEGGLQDHIVVCEPNSVVATTFDNGSLHSTRNIQKDVIRPRKKRIPRDIIPDTHLSVDSQENSLVKSSKGEASPSHSQGGDFEPVLGHPLRKRRSRTKVHSNNNASEGLADGAVPRNALATEILQNLAKFSHCILLTHVGQFYESYFEQAEEVASLLHIKLTHRTWDKQRIPMCGFPLMQLDKYLKVLVQHHKRFVAISEEFSRPPPFSAKDGFDRKVVRVITPGTLIDESFLNPYENNYLLAINPSNSSTPDGSVGLAWIDVSTGEFFSKSSSHENFRDELTRISPREIVLDRNLEGDVSHPIRQVLLEEDSFVSYATPLDTEISVPPVAIYDCSDDLVAPFDVPQTSSPPVLEKCETSAVKLLTSFLRANLLDRMPELSSPSREMTEGRMQIDSNTIKALEIRESMIEGGTKGSLLSVIKRTNTTGGTRLLARWLCSPSTSIKEINTRQSLVSFLHARPHLREDLVSYLSNVEDVSRIVQKFIFGRGEPSDLASIHSTISVWDSIKRRLELEKKFETEEWDNNVRNDWASVDALTSRITDLGELANKISLQLGEDSIRTADVDTLESVVEPLDTLRSGFWRQSLNKWAINPRSSAYLSALHSDLRELLGRKDQLERELQRKYEAPSLTLRSSPGQGMHVHVQRSKRYLIHINASPLFVKLMENGSTATFFYKEWSILGNRILNATSAIYAAEKEAFETIRNDVIANSLRLRRNARVLDELDVTIAFANLAKEMNFVRPILVEDASYDVTNGRHPAVELGLLAAGRVFTPNSVTLTPTSRIHVVTGPNMAGKSTLLRQSALIAILAQIGSFVPADHAVIGIVDKLFSRVGAKDDLFRDRSTFMVEMLETATILRRATKRSLVIMDEVGRGTTVKDGLAIAFATIYHLLAVNQCRSLFATHFHELSDMLGYSEDNKGSGVFKDVAFFCTSADEIDSDHFAYSYRVRPGVNRESQGLKVAELAGMPHQALSIAKEALLWLKSRSEGEIIRSSNLRALGQSLVKKGTPGY